MSSHHLLSQKDNTASPEPSCSAPCFEFQLAVYRQELTTSRIEATRRDLPRRQIMRHASCLVILAS
jgi:hypothetical protein